MQVLDNKSNGGEGGIRTLGTGVSPYNGLANSARPLPIARNQSHTITSDAPSRTESGYSAGAYAPQYAPPPTGIDLRTRDRSVSLISCSVSELRPHPSYARHGLSVNAAQLSALASRGDLAFQEPIVVTRSRTIIDGYARWRLAQHQHRTTLLCAEHDLTEVEALQWLIHRHGRSRSINAFHRIMLYQSGHPMVWKRRLCPVVQ